MKISFDFDGCLADHKLVKLICQLLLESKHDVHIISYRHPDETNMDLWQVVKELNIVADNVHCINLGRKADWVKKLNIDYHFDNDYEDILEINRINMREIDDNCGIFVNFDNHELSNILNRF